MAIKTQALSDEQRKVFTLAYRWYEKYHAMDGTADNWKQATNDWGRACYDAGHSDLAERLMNTVYDTIEAAQKAREKAEREAPSQPEQTVMLDADGRPVTY